MVGYKDMRDYLELLEGKGLLKHITAPVNLKYEVGGIAARSLDKGGDSLVGLQKETLRDDPDFRLEFDSLIRSMQIASQLGVGAVHSYGFCWPGEWSVGQPTWSKAPTWPMKWLTRGGVIAEVDFQKLVAAFSLVLELSLIHI